jgi:hypothetical protein
MPPFFSFPTIRSLGSIAGVANGAFLTADIPNRGTHYGVFLRGRTAAGVLLTPAQLNADIDLITLRINGEPKIELTCTEALMLQQHYGAADSADNVNGIVPIPLHPRNLATWQEKRALAWGMKDVRSFTIEINLAAALAQLSSLELWTLSSDEERNLGTHVLVRRFGQNYASTGEHEITSLLKDTAEIAYKSLFINKPGASTITAVSVKADGVLVYDRVPEELNQVIIEDGKQQVQTGYYPVCFDSNGDLSGMLSMAGIKDFRPQVTWATAAPNSYMIIAEIYAGLKAA